MDKGEYFGTLKCSNAYYFEYQNSFEEDDGFACYICEIYSFNLENSDAASSLQGKNYRFLTGNQELGIPNVIMENVILESGELFINLYCENFTLILAKD